MKFKNYLLIVTLLVSCKNIYAAEYDSEITLPRGIELSLPVSGVIKTLDVVAGQRVDEGDVMLMLDQTPFEAAKVYAESLVAVQQTLLQESLRDLNNEQELYDRTVLASVQLENAELKVKRDKANLKNAEAQLDVTNYELSYSKLTAPFSSLILSVHVNQGQSVNNSIESKILITLVRRGHYLASFTILADAFDEIQIDQPVTVRSQDESYQGKISGILIEPAKAGGEHNTLFRVEASFVSDEKLLLIGKKVSVEIN